MATSNFGELRSDGDRRAVRFERLYRAEIRELWAAITEPERLARWFADVSGELREGGLVFVDFGDGDHTELVVRRCEPPDLLEVDWSFAEERHSVVVVELTAVDDATLLVLDHRALPDGAATGYAAGWHAFLDRLVEDIAGADPRERSQWQERFEELIGDYREAATPKR